METTSNICRNKFASIFCSTANTMTTYRPTATVIIDDKIHLPSRTWLVTEAWTTSPHSSSISSSNSSSSDDPCLIRSNERCLNSNSNSIRNKTSFNLSSLRMATSHRRLRRSTSFLWTWTSHRGFQLTTFCPENSRYIFCKLVRGYLKMTSCKEGRRKLDFDWEGSVSKMGCLKISNFI